MNKAIKQRIKNGEKLIGTHLTTGDYWVADIYGLSGVDYVWIDSEHSPQSLDSICQCLSLLKAHGTACFIRTQMNDFDHTKKILDMGADGIIFPMVETAEQARECLSFTYYPTKGRRGFGPSKALDYGFRDAAEYIADEENICRFVQIESPKAVANLKEIAAVEGIDGFIIGPCDMAVNCGDKGNPFAPTTLAMIKETIATLKNMGKYVGVSVGADDIETQKTWVELGADMISSGVDTAYVLNGVRRVKNQLSALWSK